MQSALETPTQTAKHNCKQPLDICIHVKHKLSLTVTWFITVTTQLLDCETSVSVWFLFPFKLISLQLSVAVISHVFLGEEDNLVTAI